MKKLLFIICGFFMAVPAFAQFAPYQPITSYRIDQSGNPPYWPTVQAACDEAARQRGTTPPSTGAINQTFAFPNGTQAAANCLISDHEGPKQNRGIYYNVGPASCPPNSTQSGGQCTCNAGTTQTGPSGGQTCQVPPNPCTAKTGIPQTTNWTVGYTRTDGLGSNSDDYLCVGGCNVIPANKMICDAGCTVEQTGASAAWRSTQPTSNGLYRMSLDLITVPTGGQCSMSDASSAPTNPATPNPTCPGFVGEVNGKTTCVGTAAKPVTGTQADRSVQGAKPANPAAGTKPATGEGSGTTGAGRTPSTGTGGASGGPASAATGPSGTTTVTGGGGPGVDTVEQAACGAPGQPKCGIDETGTPDGKDTLTGKHGEFDDKLGEREAALSTVTSSSGKDTSWGIVPAWTQAGTCSAWHIFSLPPALGGFSVDVDLCPIKPLADGVANFIWVFLAIFAITGMIFKTMTSGGN